VIVNLSGFSLALLMSYLSLHNSSASSPPLPVSVSVFMHLLSSLSAFATCLGLSYDQSGEGGGRQRDLEGKKSLDKSLSQLEIALRSKHLRPLL
jgi:hypothetical protein